MTFRTERCPVGNNTVTLVADFEGTVTMVICPDYEYASGACAYRQRRADAGPLTDFIERMSSGQRPGKSTRCVYWPSQS